jgi:hypothetical protein
MHYSQAPNPTPPSKLTGELYNCPTLGKIDPKTNTFFPIPSIEAFADGAYHLIISSSYHLIISSSLLGGMEAGRVSIGHREAALYPSCASSRHHPNAPHAKSHAIHSWKGLFLSHCWSILSQHKCRRAYASIDGLPRCPGIIFSHYCTGHCMNAVPHMSRLLAHSGTQSQSLCLCVGD